VVAAQLLPFFSITDYFSLDDLVGQRCCAKILDFAAAVAKRLEIPRGFQPAPADKVFAFSSVRCIVIQTPVGFG